MLSGQNKVDSGSVSSTVCSGWEGSQVQYPVLYVQGERVVEFSYQYCMFSVKG